MSRPFGTAAELERRRCRAVQAVTRGESPEVVARTYGIHRASVYRWLAMARQADGLAAKPHPGPAPRLSPQQHRRLEELLLQGAKAHGWLNELWTCTRIRILIQRHFGISFHHDHVGRLLRQRLKWTPQKPQRSAREQDKVDVAFFRHVRFPNIAAAARERNAHLVFLDESGYLLTPTVRRTWAPRGQGAVLDCWDRRDRLSAISCLTVSPRTSRLNLYFQLLPHNVHGEDVVTFLRYLKRMVTGPLSVLWDRGPVHKKSKVVQAYLAEHSEIVTEELPTYAPQLNPDELVWSWSKYGRLANLAADNTDDLAERVIDELVYLKQHPELLASFVDKTELKLAA
jgi:transposase